MCNELYSAMLLFQYRADIEEASRNRQCESRVLVFEANGIRHALEIAMRKGIKHEFDYIDKGGTRWFFEFVAVTDLVEIDRDTSEDGVWFEIQHLDKPMERRDQLQVWIDADNDVIRPARKRYVYSRAASIRERTRDDAVQGVDEPQPLNRDWPIGEMIGLSLLRAGVSSAAEHWHWPSDTALKASFGHGSAGFRVVDDNGQPVDLTPLQAVLIRLCWDADFLNLLKVDMHGALKDHGYILSNDELAAFGQVDLSAFDNHASRLRSSVNRMRQWLRRALSSG